MDDQFQDLQRLLRLKRHEAPPPGYHDDFMREFHRRQREELLRRPLWRLALDRLEAMIPTFSPSRYAYVGAYATAIVTATVVSARILTAPVHSPTQANTTTVAAVSKNRPQINIYSDKPSSLRLSPELNFDEPRRVATSSPAANRTRYVLDASPIQPVVYEHRSDF